MDKAKWYILSLVMPKFCLEKHKCKYCISQVWYGCWYSPAWTSLTIFIVQPYNGCWGPDCDKYWNSARNIYGYGVERVYITAGGIFWQVHVFRHSLNYIMCICICIYMCMCMCMCICMCMCTTGSWRSCLIPEVVSSIPAGSTINYQFFCGFICVSLCQSIKIKPTNMFIASARVQFKINTQVLKLPPVHSRRVVSCPVQPRACHWNCVYWHNFSGVKRSCWTTDSWLSCLSLEFDPRRVHNNLSVPLWVYMRFPVPEHQNQTNKYVYVYVYEYVYVCMCLFICILYIIYTKICI